MFINEIANPFERLANCFYSHSRNGVDRLHQPDHLCQSQTHEGTGRTKNLGARSGDFILQFIIESLVMNALSILGAITLVQCIKLPLQNFFQVHVFSGGISATPIGIVVLIAITGIIITGVYPALSVMMKSARNLLTDGRLHDFYVGKSLTVFQFSVAIILLISVFAIYSQLSYILNKDLGVQRDEVIVLDLPENPNSYPRSVLNTFLTKLSTLSDVKDFGSAVPFQAMTIEMVLGCSEQLVPHLWVLIPTAVWTSVS